MNKALADFVQDPLSYDISEMMGEDEITDMAYQVEMLRKELYEASGRNRDVYKRQPQWYVTEVLEKGVPCPALEEIWAEYTKPILLEDEVLGLSLIHI